MSNLFKKGEVIYIVKSLDKERNVLTFARAHEVGEDTTIDIDLFLNSYEPIAKPSISVESFNAAIQELSSNDSSIYHELIFRRLTIGLEKIEHIDFEVLEKNVMKYGLMILRNI